MFFLIRHNANQWFASTDTPAPPTPPLTEVLLLPPKPTTHRFEVTATMTTTRTLSKVFEAESMEDATDMAWDECKSLERSDCEDWDFVEEEYSDCEVEKVKKLRS